MFCEVLLIHPGVLVLVITAVLKSKMATSFYPSLYCYIYHFMYLPLPQPRSPTLHYFLPSIPFTLYLFLSLYLSLSTSLYFSISLNLYIYTSTSLYLSLYMYMSISTSISRSISLPLSLSIYLCTFKREKNVHNGLFLRILHLCHSTLPPYTSFYKQLNIYKTRP